ncbi:MAG: mRNA-degrading endonuclease toxin of MazEF toxin-antitoxin module, partial [Gammaproteobacteria bacterium]
TNLEVKLSGTKTKGAILVQQMRSLDYESLFAEFIERTPEKVTAQVRSIAQILVR